MTVSCYCYIYHETHISVVIDRGCLHKEVERL